MREELQAHIEAHLSRLERPWTTERDGTPLPFEIRPIADRPMRSATTFVTLGISDEVLAFPSGAPAKQELVVSTYSRYRASDIPAVLAGLGMKMLAERRAYARGEVIGPAGPITPETRLEAFYCSLPAYLPDEFAGLYATEPATLFVWLVPITANEANYVRTHGWSKFEDLLAEQDPDLLDLRREEIKLPC